MGELLLKFVREVDLGTEEDHAAARYCPRLVVRWSCNCGVALTGDGQIADEVVAVACREPLCQVCFWKLSTDDWSGLEGSVFLQMSPELRGRRYRSLLVGDTIRVAVLLGGLSGQVLGWGHFAEPSVENAGWKVV